MPTRVTKEAADEIPDRLSIRLEPVTMMAIQQAADSARLSKSDFMRQLAGFVTGVDRPDLQQKTQKIQEKYSRATVKQMFEAAWEYYLDLATECGLDANLFPDIRPKPTRRR